MGSTCLSTITSKSTRETKNKTKMKLISFITRNSLLACFRMSKIPLKFRKYTQYNQKQLKVVMPPFKAAATIKRPLTQLTLDLKIYFFHLFCTYSFLSQSIVNSSLGNWVKVPFFREIFWSQAVSIKWRWGLVGGVCVLTTALAEYKLILFERIVVLISRRDQINSNFYLRCLMSFLNKILFIFDIINFKIKNN